MKTLFDKSLLLIEKYAIIIVIFIAFLSYRGVLSLFFVQDDFWFLKAVQNPQINSQMFFGVLSNFWRPIPTYWFPLLSKFLFGYNAFGYHLIQMIFFMLTIFYMYKAIIILIDSKIGALTGISVYGLSKIHLYTLGWIAGAIDNIACFFYILTLYFFLKYQRSGKNLVLMVIAFGMALLSKESVIVLPIIMGIYWLTIKGELDSKKSFKAIISLFIMLFIYLLIWVLHVPSQGLGLNLNRTLQILQYSIIAIVPTREYPEKISLIILFICLLLFLVLALKKRFRGTAALSFLLWLLPSTIFMFTKIPVGLQPYYGTLSVIGLSILISCWVTVLLENNFYYLKRIMLFLVLGIYICESFQVNESGIKKTASPSIFEEKYSTAAYKQLMTFMLFHQYKEVHIINISDLMWWAIGKGDLVPVMFPGTQVKIDGKDSKINHEERTNDNILVIKQVNEFKFEVIK